MHGNAVATGTPNSGRCAREPRCRWPQDRARSSARTLNATVVASCRRTCHRMPSRAHTPCQEVVIMCQDTVAVARVFVFVFETLHALYMPSQSSLAQHHVAAPQAMVIFPVDACPGKEHVFTSLRSKTAPWAQPASLRLGASPLWTPPSSRLSSSAWLRLAPHHAAPRQATRALQHSVQQAAFVSQHSALQHCSRPPIGRRRLRRCQRATVLTSSAVVQPLTVVHHSRHADHCRAS